MINGMPNPVKAMPIRKVVLSIRSIDLNVKIG